MRCEERRGAAGTARLRARMDMRLGTGQRGAAKVMAVRVPACAGPSQATPTLSIRWSRNPAMGEERCGGV